MTLAFYASVAKVLKLEVRKFCELSPTFVEVTGEKLVAGREGVGRGAWIGLREVFVIKNWEKEVGSSDYK